MLRARGRLLGGVETQRTIYRIRAMATEKWDSVLLLLEGSLVVSNKNIDPFPSLQ